MQKLYIGGLPYSIDDSRLSEMLSPFGTVASANVIMDRTTNTSRGFGFVEMSSKDEANKAITELNGTTVDGRTLTVNEAKPRSSDGGGGGRY